MSIKNQSSRRKFVQSIVLGGTSIPFLSFGNESFLEEAIIKISPNTLPSTFLKAELNTAMPGFSMLSIDSLGKNKLTVNPLRTLTTEKKYKVKQNGKKTEYRFSEAPDNSSPAWTCEVSDKSIKLRSDFSSLYSPQPLVLNFDPKICHVTLLGLLKENEPKIKLPAIMHFPDMGTFRISSSQGKKVSLGFDASRYSNPNFVTVTFDPASAINPLLEYTLEVVTIYPAIDGIEKDARFDAFRRDFLNIFQINPRMRTLANHASSDIVPFTVQEYAKVALVCPPLANGLTAMDMLKQTLQHYLNGKKGYGQVGYTDKYLGGESVAWPMPYDSLDTYPGLIIAASYYYEGTKDKAWLEKNYSIIQSWATTMLAMDQDDDGLIEFPITGNAGSYYDGKMRTSNWWDAISFGHKDAYSNALAYHSLEEIAKLSKVLGKTSDGKSYEQKAKKLKDIYYNTFYNPATGILAGWKSADGKLHDYYFTFIQAYAIYYGLVDNKKGNALMDKILAKMKEVGYTNFSLGLPGNLIPIKKEDYIPVGCCGAPTKDDGTDTFQVYENGGATACHVYYTIESLYKLGRKSEAEAILFPMLKSFDEGKFQGVGANGKTNDWKRWDGTPEGYEGLLVDGYLALLSVLTMKKQK